VFASKRDERRRGDSGSGSVMVLISE
jgi:hypothetical protein